MLSSLTIPVAPADRARLTAGGTALKPAIDFAPLAEHSLQDVLDRANDPLFLLVIPYIAFQPLMNAYVFSKKIKCEVLHRRYRARWWSQTGCTRTVSPSGRT